MDSDFFNSVSQLDGINVHITVFALLLMGGLGFPIPEDIPILAGGVAGASGIVPLHHIFVTCYAGVLIADQMVFFLGYYFGQRLLTAGTRSRFFPAITEERVEEIRSGLRRRRLLYIFLGRHLFPVRSVTFLTAGALRIPFLEFFVSDALAALVSVSIVLGLGYYIGESLSPEILQHLITQAHFYILLSVAASALFYFWRKQRRKRQTR